jgi:sugar/nucleoside kinase (ribokinase family)
MHYDVLGLGCAAVDDLLYVDAWPDVDVKVRVKRRERQCGGLTATALVAAARLGARCAFAGILGTEGNSQFILDALTREGVDVTHVVRRAEVRPIHSTIIVDETHHTRNIFFDLEGSVGADTTSPPAEVIQSSRVLFVDHYGIEGMIRAVDVAHAAGAAVVADLERSEWPGFADLIARVDHLVLSRQFACRWTKAADAEEAVRRLWSPQRRAVVVTCGEEGGWYMGDPEPASPTRYHAFPVQTVDTTGCGDVFHGAYASALARGLALPERIRFAAAAAAIKATRRGAQAGIPTRAETEAFLRNAECGMRNAD